MPADPSSDAIDYASPVALHYQLRTILSRQIESGAYRPGDRFPTSQELRDRYQVSTTTVEHALRWLAENGLVYRKPGRGTVVSAPPVTEELARLTGISEAAELQGLEFKNRILRAEFTEPGEREAALLSLRPGEKLFRLDRLNTLRDEKPIAVEQGVYPPDVGERFVADPTTMSGSLYRTLESRFGLHLDKASQVIGAIPAGRREAGLLDIRVGVPLVSFDRVTYLVGGRPIQFVRCCLPAARYAFHVWLKRRDDDGASVLSFGGSRLSPATSNSQNEQKTWREDYP